MQNGYVPINLNWQWDGQFSPATLAHGQRSIRFFGVQRVKGRTTPPQGFVPDRGQWLGEHPAGTAVAYKTKFLTGTRWPHPLQYPWILRVQSPPVRLLNAGTVALFMTSILLPENIQIVSRNGAVVSSHGLL